MKETLRDLLEVSAKQKYLYCIQYEHRHGSCYF